MLAFYDWLSWTSFGLYQCECSDTLLGVKQVLHSGKVNWCMFNPVALMIWVFCRCPLILSPVDSCVSAGVRQISGNVCCGLKDRATLVFLKTTRATLSSVNTTKSAPFWPSLPVYASLNHSAAYWKTSVTAVEHELDHLHSSNVRFRVVH